MYLNKNDIKKGERKFDHIINKYTKLDPTIPRISNIQCPNVECPTNKDDKHKAEILYIRYDEDNLKYIYMCSMCDTTWKTNEKKVRCIKSIVYFFIKLNDNNKVFRNI